MKKILAMLLAFVLLLSLCACSNSDSQLSTPSSSSQSTNSSISTSTPVSTPSSTPASTPEDEPASTPTSTPDDKPASEPTSTPLTCSHNWTDANCTAPKTCSKCGVTEGSAAGHSWNAATCTAPKTCSKCGATEGSAAGHSWNAATCTAPKTCSKCGATEGSAAGHSYSNGTCTVCGTADPNVPFTDNEWIAYIVKAGTSEQGEVLSEYALKPTKFQGYTYKDYYSNVNYDSSNNGSITYNGKTYYDFWFSSDMNGITWVDNGDTVTVTFAYNEPVIELVLTRTGEAQFTVTSSSDTVKIPVGTIFNKQ